MFGVAFSKTYLRRLRSVVSSIGQDNSHTPAGFYSPRVTLLLYRQLEIGSRVVCMLPQPLAQEGSV